VQIFKATLGEKHPSYATSLSSLAALYQAMSQPQEAARLSEQALAITRVWLAGVVQQRPPQE
jgi:hypothetical protein